MSQNAFEILVIYKLYFFFLKYPMTNSKIILPKGIYIIDSVIFLCYNCIMEKKNYYDETDILTNGTCNYFSTLGKDTQLLHMHRQIEIMFSVKGDFFVTLGENRHHLSTGDFVIIKPFELHSFESKKSISNRFVSPIFPNIISERIANRLNESVICHADEKEWGKILSLYKSFKDMSQKNRILYFEMIENLVTDATSPKIPLKKNHLADKIISYINENAAAPLTLESVAAACYTNRCTVSKIINTQCNKNFNTYLNKVRISRFLQDYVENRPKNLEAAAQNAGFQSPRTFYRAFFDEFKMTPTEYIEKLSINEQYDKKITTINNFR